MGRSDLLAAAWPAMSARGFGVAAGLDPAVATPLAERCEELGYSSMWSNDHPAAAGSTPWRPSPRAPGGSSWASP